MKIQIYNCQRQEVIPLNGFLKNSLILVFNEINIEQLLKLSFTHKILIVSDNNYYKNLKLNNVYFLNSTKNYLCFNGIVVLASTIVNDTFINLINKWIDYKLVVITTTYDCQLNNDNYTYIHTEINDIIKI